MWTPAGYGSAGVAFRRIPASGSATPAATSGGDKRSRPQHRSKVVMDYLARNHATVACAGSRSASLHMNAVEEAWRRSEFRDPRV